MMRSRKAGTRGPAEITTSFLVPQKPFLEILRWTPQEENVGNAQIFKSTEARRGSM